MDMLKRKVGRFKKGNDIAFDVVLTRKGHPEDLSNKDLDVRLVNSYGESCIISYTEEGNLIHIIFYGIDQKRNGMYFVVVNENKGKPGMSTVSCPVFELVSLSMLVTDSFCPTKKETLTFCLDISFPNYGASAYDIAVKHGFDGTEDEWLDSLNGGSGSGNVIVVQTTGKSTKNVMSQKAVTDLIVFMQTKMSEMQDQIDQLIAGGGGDVPVLPTVTDALMLNNGKYLMLRNGNYIKIKSTIN